MFGEQNRSSFRSSGRLAHPGRRQSAPRKFEGSAKYKKNLLATKGYKVCKGVSCPLRLFVANYPSQTEHRVVNAMQHHQACLSTGSFQNEFEQSFVELASLIGQSHEKDTWNPGRAEASNFCSRSVNS